MQMALTAAQILSALIVVVFVLLQEENDRGLSALTGGSDSFFSRNINSTPKEKLRKATVWVGLLFVLLTVALGIFVNLW